MHHSSFVRIAALSIVIKSASSSTVSTSSFSTETLQLLEQILPHFHTENNAKARNEYLVLIKSLYAHVRRGLVPHHREILAHAVHADEKTIANPDEGQDSTAQVRRSQAFLEKSATFLEWFDKFLINELHPTASYQRHITALRAMSCNGLTARFNKGAINISSCNRTDSKSHNTAHDFLLGFQPIRLLFDLIMDPFDDVRSAAASLLRDLLSNVDSKNIFLHPNISIKLQNNKDRSHIDNSSPVRHDFKNIFVSTLNRAENMMSCTGRADHADGFGRFCHLKFDFYHVINTSVGTQGRISVLDDLLSYLSENITNLRNDFSFAVGSSPLHGNLIALRYPGLNSSAALAITNCEDREIISSSLFKEEFSTKNSRCHIEQLTFRILECCNQIWEVVKQYLCIDSPEGFEMDDGEDQDSGMGPKDTLSFAWRALKESRYGILNQIRLILVFDLHFSSLSSALIASGACRSSISTQYDGVQRIGDLAFTQLAELRHRGAFSTVAQTFATCCVAAVKENSQRGDEAIANRTGSSLSTYLLDNWYRVGHPSFLEIGTGKLPLTPHRMPCLSSRKMHQHSPGDQQDYQQLSPAF